jgi:hypothetical protein
VLYTTSNGMPAIDASTGREEVRLRTIAARCVQYASSTLATPFRLFVSTQPLFASAKAVGAFLPRRQFIEQRTEGFAIFGESIFNMPIARRS